MTFDQKCFVLAEHFLVPTASERRKNILAQKIQQTIEDDLDENGEGETVDIEAVPC